MKQQTSSPSPFWTALFLAGLWVALAACGPTAAPSTVEPIQPTQAAPTSVSPSAAMPGTPTGCPETAESCPAIPQPPASTTTQTVRIETAGISLSIPAGWQPASAGSYEGADGYVKVEMLDWAHGSLEQVCETWINLRSTAAPGGPRLEMSELNGRELCAIFNTPDAQLPSEVIFYDPARSPDPFWKLSADPEHIQAIATSLVFDSTAAQPTPAPVTLEIPADLPAPELTVTRLGDLTLEEYAVVEAAVDTPSHFEFNQRIPDDIFEKHADLRSINLEQAVELNNPLLAPFGYRLEANLVSGGVDGLSLYRGDEVLMQIDNFRPVQVNRSGTDFALVVEGRQGTQVVSKERVETWDLARHANCWPVYAGDDLVAVRYSDNDVLEVVRNGAVIFTWTVAGPGVKEPVEGLWGRDGHWQLLVDGTLIVDGEAQNEALGVDEIFEWQLLNGVPFYFFSADGKVGLAYGGGALSVQYDEVIHGRCCEPAAFNPRRAPDLISFYARRDGKWYYVDLGAFASE